MATAALAGLIVLGSRNLAHFDAALVGYTFACLFAAFGIAYRYVDVAAAAADALYWRRGWQLFLRPRFLGTQRRRARPAVWSPAFAAEPLHLAARSARAGPRTG